MGIFGARNPEPEKVQTQKRQFNRKQRKNGRFIIEIDGKYLEMIKPTPFEYRLVENPYEASFFNYQNAQRVVTQTIAKSPLIYYVSTYKGQMLLS